MVRHIRTTLITALETALKFGLVSRNVAKLVDPPRVPKREIIPFTVDEARRFLEVIKGDRLGNLFVIMLSLGLRLGEALGLAWDDIDFERSRLTVRHGLEKLTGKRFRLVETKSEHGYRTIFLPAVALAALHHQRAAQDRELAGSAWKGNSWGLVFTSTTGAPLHQRNVHRRFWKLLDAAGLRRIRPHDLRHSAASLLIADGVHPKAIQELLGHASVAFTLQVYAHLFEEARQEAADRMDSILAPVASSVASSEKQTAVQ
jgi:integrase